MTSWLFTNVTRSVAFDVRTSSLSISDNRPCELATIGGTIYDLAADIVLENEDEISVTETPDGGAPVVVFAGDVTKRVRTDVAGHIGPRVYQFTAQDFTARLDDNIITEARDVIESAADRVAWIMGWSNRGLTFTSVEAIADSVPAENYVGMSVRAALNQVASYVDAIYYVDYSKDLHFFQTENRPAPFDLLNTNTPPTSYPYRDFSMEDATPDLAHAVFVQGDGVSLWRTDPSDPGAPDRQERSAVDNRITTIAGAEARGDTLLAQYNAPTTRGSLRVFQPGLQGGMSIRIVNPDWSIDDTYVITSVRTSTPGPQFGIYDIGFSDRYLCSASLPAVASAAISLPVQVKAAVNQQFVDLAQAGANQIRNSSFESTSDWTQGSLWSAGYASANPYFGSKTARTAPTGSTTGELVTTDFIAVDRTADWWFSFWSFLSAYTAGTARCRVREYDAGGSLLQSTDVDLTAAETAWTRHSLHFGSTVTDSRLAFHASTAKLKIALWALTTPTLTWEVDAFQLERSPVLTSYAPAPYELMDGSVTTEAMADLAVTLGKLAALSVDNSKLVDAAVDAVKLADAAVENAKLAINSVDMSKFTAGVRPVAVFGPDDTLALWEDGTGMLWEDGSEVVWDIWSDSLPALPDALYPIGTVVYNNVDHKLYRNVAEEWVRWVDGADLFARSVTAREIQALTITAAEIAFGTITGDKILARTITSAEIAAGTITATELSADIVIAATVAAGSITALELASGAVTTDKLLANAVTAAKIAAATITAAQIAAGTITANEIAAATITAAKIAGATITATQLAADSVTATQIAAGAVNTTELNASAVIKLVTNSGSTAVIDASGLTVTGGAISVVNSGGTTIIDGSSRMYRIAATGVLNTGTRGGAGVYATDTDTYTGMGTMSVPLSFIAHAADTAATTGGVKVGSLWLQNPTLAKAATLAGSGQAHDIDILAFTDYGEVATYLTGAPGYCVVELGGTGQNVFPLYANYQLLSEAVL